MRGKRYPPEEIEKGLEALAESGGNVTVASKATGIPRTTLIGWKNANFDEFDELRREKRGGLIDKVWAAAEEALNLGIANLPTMKGKDQFIAFAILTEKGLLLGGEPTDIVKQLPQITFRGVEMDEYEERERE